MATGYCISQGYWFESSRRSFDQRKRSAIVLSGSLIPQLTHMITNIIDRLWVGPRMSPRLGRGSCAATRGSARLLNFFGSAKTNRTARDPSRSAFATAPFSRSQPRLPSWYAESTSPTSPASWPGSAQPPCRRCWPPPVANAASGSPEALTTIGDDRGIDASGLVRRQRPPTELAAQPALPTRHVGSRGTRRHPASPGYTHSG